MIEGIVSKSGIPLIFLDIAGREWPTTIDTGFNGDLELPEALASSLKIRYFGRATSLLAGNQLIEEDQFIVEFPFDGQTIRAVATFVFGDGILLGTNMLRDYELFVNFPSRYVSLKRKE